MSNPDPQDPFLVFGQPSIEESDIQEVVDCLRSGWIGRGPRVSRFEKQFAAYKGVPEAVAVNSCSSGLLLALRAAGIGPGDEVITTPLTFCATINAILHAGATPVLADVHPATLNIDPAVVAQRVTDRTRAIIAVHFAGRPCDMDELAAIAARHRIFLIEDCAHAIESWYHGRPTGTIGDFGCFSFYATKNITTAEGGMVVAREAGHLETIRILAAQGMTIDAWKRFSDSGTPHYSVVAAGFKHNMTDIEAALGIHQLARVEANWERRERIWMRYREELAHLPLTLPPLPAPETRHAFHLFNILMDEAECGLSRDAFIAAMAAQRIGTAVHYRSATDQPYYQQVLGWTSADAPEATRIGRQTVSLPFSPAYTERDIQRVLKAVVDLILHRPARRQAV